MFGASDTSTEVPAGPAMRQGGHLPALPRFQHRIAMGQVYLCLSASNPKYVDPILVPELCDE